MTTPTLSSCRSCHAAITFAISPKGAKLPLDARQRHARAADAVESRAERVIGYALEDGLGELPQAVSLGWVTLQDEGGLLVYVSHFATCPDRAKFSRGKR